MWHRNLDTGWWIESMAAFSEHVTLLTALSLLWKALSYLWSILVFLWWCFYYGYFASVRISSLFNSSFAKKKITLGLLVSLLPLKETLNKTLHIVTAKRCFLTRYSHQNTPHPSVLVHFKPLSCNKFKKIVFSSRIIIHDPSACWRSLRQCRKVVKQQMRPVFKKLWNWYTAFLKLWLGWDFESFFW